MKINIILPFTSLTGGVKIIFEYSNRLKQRGHDIVIYVPVRAYSFNANGLMGMLKRIKSSLRNLLKTKRIKWFNLNVSIHIVPIISDAFIRDADVTIATAWPTAYDVEKLCKSKGKKVYFIQHYEIWSGKKEKVNGSYRLPLNQIVIAKWLQSLMRDKFNQESELIYNGLEFNDFENIPRNNQDISVGLLYHSEKLKGFEDGIAAFELAKKKYPNLKLNIFGTHEGKEIPEYSNFYKNPDKNTLKKIYSQSDIFLFPSQSEGWGLTVLEAMASGCAVVGTNTGVLNEVGIHRHNSLISEPCNVEQLATHLINVIEDDDLRKKISIEGYKLCQQFNWDISVRKLENYLENLIKIE